MTLLLWEGAEMRLAERKVRGVNRTSTNVGPVRPYMQYMGFATSVAVLINALVQIVRVLLEMR